MSANRGRDNMRPDQDRTEEAKLNERQRRFIDFYVGEARGNATRAATMAGYSPRGAFLQGHRMLRKAHIRAAIEQLTSDALSPAEVLAEYADIARNASMAPLLKVGDGRPSLDLLDERGRAKP